MVETKVTNEIETGVAFMLEKHTAVQQLQAEQDQGAMHDLVMQAYHGSQVRQEYIGILASLGLVESDGARIEDVGWLVRVHAEMKPDRTYGWKAFDEAKVQEFIKSGR